VRIALILSASALLAMGSPVTAAVSYQLQPTKVTGFDTITTYRSDCAVSGLPLGICSVETRYAESYIVGTLTPMGSDIGKFFYSTFNPGSRVSGTVTLTYSGTELISTEFSGGSSFLSGPYSNGILTEGRYTAREFPIYLYDTNGETVLAPVPEPGTWALMLLGFGAIGWSLRRRRKAGLVPRLA
jgi:hypothetical protein